MSDQEIITGLVEKLKFTNDLIQKHYFEITVSVYSAGREFLKNRTEDIEKLKIERKHLELIIDFMLVKIIH